MSRIGLCHIARQARHFWKNFFTFFWGVFFGMLLWDLRLGGDAGVSD